MRPIGSQKEIAVDVRILCATHKDLAALVRQGDFRQDLFYRLNVIELAVPSLRQRTSDISQLAGHILDKLAETNGGTPFKLALEALEVLQGYLFPGNIRELENILERAVTLCESETIGTKDLRLPQVELPSSSEFLPANSLEERLAGLEKQTILQALEQTRYNKTAAAKILGITFRALRYRLKKLELE